MSELQRILALPLLTTPPVGSERLDELAGGILRPLQRQALAEAMLCRGLVAPIAVGGGKTLITLLLPAFLLSERPLLLVPSKLKEKTTRDYERYRRDGWWVTCPRIESYELLSRRDDWLWEYSPDLVMADEGHKLKNKKAACTRKIARFLQKNQNIPFVALSGTFLSRTLTDCIHLFAWALREGSPLPLTWVDAQDWAMILDDETDNFCWQAGQLSIFGTDQTKIREAVHRRIVSTPGVVATTNNADECPASILLDEWPISLTKDQRKILDVLEKKWELPNGDLLTQPVDVWRHGRDIIQGFFYRWEPPPPRDWLEARREWKKFVREILKNSRILDSEAQVAKKYRDLDLYRKWMELKPTYTYTLVPEIITKTVIEAAANWVRENDGIVWTDRRVVGEIIMRDFGIPYYGSQGLCGKHFVDDASGPICASIAANCEGRNLQKWSKMLVLSPPTRGSIWEQMIGRLHRYGQVTETVEIYANIRRSNLQAIKHAIQDAQYQRDLFGKEMKLLLADVTFSDKFV